MTATLRQLRRLREYPSAVIGLAVIGALVFLSIYTVIAIPHDEAVRLWRGGEEVWSDTPRNAWPLWYNWITRRNRPQTLVVHSSDPEVSRSVEEVSDDITEVSLTFPIDYAFDGFPPEMILFLEPEYKVKPPFVSLTWHTPDGREIRIGDVTPNRSDSFRFAQDKGLKRRLGGARPEIGLFADPAAESPTPLQGTYRLELKALMFEKAADFKARLVVYGQVHGLAGTDHQRRDLMVALLWGTPIAMAFGLLAAVGTTVTTMAIAAIGVWFGGALDGAIQRVTEVNLILPLLPILIMIGTFYSRSIWMMLALSPRLSGM
ncbi:MAG: hypothetical protein ACE5EL_02335 [Anaerolineae bacterium]